MELFPFFLALSVGFTHAFEADHLVAVSNIVMRRSSVRLALKDGVYWGLGHTSTILLVGCVFILGRVALRENDFRYLEAGVGVMLVVLGAIRLYRHSASATTRLHEHSQTSAPHQHTLAYGVGLMHGLAGSGALLLSVLTQVRGSGAGLLYLGLFGVGSIGGMMVAAGAFSVPFSARLTSRAGFQSALVVLSALLCIGLGSKILYENLFA